MTEFQPVPTEDFEDDEPLDSRVENDYRRQPLRNCRTLKALGFCPAVVAVIVLVLCRKNLTPGSKPIAEDHSSRSKATNISPPLVNMSSVRDIMDANLPFFVYGSGSKQTRNQTVECVVSAIRHGLRWLDTSNQHRYYHETGTGLGWTTAARALGLERSDLYIQTKFSPLTNISGSYKFWNQTVESVEQNVLDSMAESLQHLQTTYLDAFILHAPYPEFETNLKVWRVMESLVDKGTVLRLGLSNFDDLETVIRLYNKARIKPAILINQFSARHFDVRLLEFARQHGMYYQTFWNIRLNKKALYHNEEIANMTADKGLNSTIQYLYAFLFGIGITPMDGTKSHFLEDATLLRNVQTKELSLSKAEIQRMANALQMDLPV